MDFIGIDIGTSRCKASVISEFGTILATASREYALLNAKPGWAALDLNCVWSSVKETLKEIAPHAANVKFATASSLGETMVLLDKEDQICISEGITYIDVRNAEVWNQMANRVDPGKLYEITGKGMPQIAMVNQYL